VPHGILPTTPHHTIITTPHSTPPVLSRWGRPRGEGRDREPERFQNPIWGQMVGTAIDQCLHHVLVGRLMFHWLLPLRCCCAGWPGPSQKSVTDTEACSTTRVLSSNDYLLNITTTTAHPSTCCPACCRYRIQTQPGKAPSDLGHIINQLTTCHRCASTLSHCLSFSPTNSSPRSLLHFW
jgi:hypothetical protein